MAIQAHWRFVLSSGWVGSRFQVGRDCLRRVLNKPTLATLPCIYQHGWKQHILRRDRSHFWTPGSASELRSNAGAADSDSAVTGAPDPHKWPPQHWGLKVSFWMNGGRSLCCSDPCCSPWVCCVECFVYMALEEPLSSTLAVHSWSAALLIHHALSMRYYSELFKKFSDQWERERLGGSLMCLYTVLIP